MTRKEWAAVAVVIGGGILLQVAGHDGMQMDRGAVGAEDTASVAEPPGPFRQVALDVTGMT